MLVTYTCCVRILLISVSCISTQRDK